MVVEIMKVPVVEQISVHNPNSASIPQKGLWSLIPDTFDITLQHQWIWNEKVRD